MGRKVIAIWLSLVMMVSLVVFVDVSLDFSLNVGGTTLYVNTTGSGGAYTSIQDAIDNASDGNTVFVYTGTYYEHVVVNKIINLTGEARDWTVIDGGASGDVIEITVNWANISGFAIQNSGNLDTPDYDSGVKLENIQNCSVNNNKFLSNRYGIRLDGSSNNYITDNIVFTSSWDGIHLVSSSNNNLVKGNNASKNNGMGIRVKGSIVNNVTDNYAFNNWDGIRLESSDRNKVTNNLVLDNTYGIYLRWSEGNLFANNTAIENGIGIYIRESVCNNATKNTMYENGIVVDGFSKNLWNTHDIDITNTVNGRPVYYWKNMTGGIVPSDAGQVILANCTNVRIENQTITNSSQGISLGYSYRNNVLNNNISWNSNKAVYLCGADENNITDNIVSNNQYSGIYLWECNSNYIASNTVHSVGLFAIYARDSHGNNFIKNDIYESSRGIHIYLSSGNNITRNSVSSSSECGLYFHYSDGNNITQNNVFENECGIEVTKSSGNRIFHNTFHGNIIQALDDRASFWNDSYPSGGNFWFDYFGFDNYQGPNQDIPGSDGIGDFQYAIDADSIDKYPLMTPYRGMFLSEGWNLISIPLIQQDQDLFQVLESIDGDYDAVQWYNGADSADPWKHCRVGKPYGNDLSLINETMGFWVHVTRPGDTLFLYDGIDLTFNQTITLNPGWNLVGYPSNTSYNRTEGLNNLTFGQEVDLIQWYDAQTQTWHDLDENDYFVPGRGYWIYAKVECEWEVPL
jgi:parallel beta-helix repeat protein